MEDQNLIQILNCILEHKSHKDVATLLNVAVGTVKRWISLDNVPKSYCFDLMKIADIQIDYSKFSFKDKDQFFTPIETSAYCYNTFLNILFNT